MKIKAGETGITLIPEHDHDCYNLGLIAQRADKSCLHMTDNLDNPKPQINGLDIAFEDLIELLIEEKR